jgi:hypothetical protein
MLPEMIRVLWDYVAGRAELENYQPDSDHQFARLGAIQRPLVDAQNMLYVNRDSIREDLTQECKNLPRTFEEVENQKESISALVEGLERAHEKMKGSEEGETMRT